MKIKQILAATLVVLAMTLSAGLKGEAATESKSVTLSGKNLIILNGEVNGETTSAVIAKSKELDNALGGVKESLSTKKTPIYLFLNTPGGSIQSGLELIEALKGLGRPVYTVCLFAASMGWQIVQNLDDRLILKNGVMMSHHATGESIGEFGGSVKSQMENRQQLWLDRVREMDEQTVKRTGGKQTYESYTKEYDHEMWLTGTKSVSEGYSDRIVTVRCDATLNGTTSHHVNFFGMDVSYELDNCPLNTSPMNIKVHAPDGKAISYEVSNMVKEKFLSEYLNKAKQVIPMYW